MEGARDVVVEDRVIGKVYWSMSEEPLVNVSIEPAGLPLVAEWAAALGGQFCEDMTSPRNLYTPHFTSPAQLRSSSFGITLVASLAIAASVLSLAFWGLATIVSLPYGHPNAPPLWQILGFTGMFMLLPAVSLAGSTCLIQRRRYWLAVTGMICLLVPVLGPCFGLTIPLGVFGLIFLWPTQVRHSFAS